MSVINRIKNINDIGLSSGLSSNAFVIENLSNYGFCGMPTAFSFDPVQGLFAAGTSNGYIHVFGQKNVEHVFSIEQNLQIQFLSIIKSILLIAVDNSNTVNVFSLDTKELLSMQSIPGRITCIATDPSMDWLFIGLDSGLINVYDVDRGINSPYSIGNLQKSFLPKARISPVRSIQIHPRDPSKILICYQECAILYQIISQQILLSFKYNLNAGAPGGDINPNLIQQNRSPPFLQAIWHPHGHHILTVHVEGSLVFWDATEGVLLQARTLTDTDVNVPRRLLAGMAQNSVPCKPIAKIAWVCTKNPEETAIVVAGGDYFEGSVQGVTVLDFGVTPIVSVTSYLKMGKHYAEPRRQRVFPTPGQAAVVDFISIPRANPFYGGGCDPKAVIFRLANGQISTLSYPDGLPISSSSVLPYAFSWVQPFITSCASASVSHNQWVGMLASTPSSDEFFSGGASGHQYLKKSGTRNALCTGYSDGSVKLWDALYHELDHRKVLEVQTSEALRRRDDCRVDKVSFAPSNAELAVGIETGETVLYKFSSGKKLASIIEKMKRMKTDENQPIVNVQNRTTLKHDGFLPQFIIDTKNGPISALLNSEIGFVVIGHKIGHLIVLDMRGPAIIFSGSLEKLSTQKARAGNRPYSNVQSSEYPTALEMGIYMLDGEKFSSIVLSVGTSMGNLHTFRVTPVRNNNFSVEYIGAIEAGNSPIKDVISFNTVDGQMCSAKSDVMNKLHRGIQISGAVITISTTDIRIFRPPNVKIAARSPSLPIAAASFCTMKSEQTSCLVTLTKMSGLVVYSLPTLGEIYKKNLFLTASQDFVEDSIIMANGEIFLRKDHLSGALFTIWGSGTSHAQNCPNKLFDEMKKPLIRPTISTIQWIKGNPTSTVQDVDTAVGGSNRPKSKTVIAREKQEREQQFAQHDPRQRRNKSNNYGGSYFDAPMKSISNAFESFETTASDYISGLNKTISDSTPTQTSLLKSAFKAKFF